MEKHLASLVECAHLSWLVGQAPSSPRSGADAHATPLLPGWKDLQSLGVPALAGQALRAGGFGAGSYINESRGDIAIAYHGLDLTQAMPRTHWHDLPGLLMDLGQVLGRGGVDISGEQRLLALVHYLSVVEWARARGHDPARLVFTGHGLGAALAASMAMWLDRPATLFAAAPFTVTGRREDRPPGIVHVSLRGELLSYAREVMPIAVNAHHDRVIEVAHTTVCQAMALHRMSLHLALLLDERLRALFQRIPELLPALGGGSQDAAEDRMAPLIDDQLRQGLGAPSALQRFVSDLETLATLEAFDAPPAMRQSLIGLLATLHGQMADASDARSAAVRNEFLDGIDVKELAPSDPMYPLHDWSGIGHCALPSDQVMAASSTAVQAPSGVRCQEPIAPRRAALATKHP